LPRALPVSREFAEWVMKLAAETGIVHSLTDSDDVAANDRLDTMIYGWK
jgi:hypothetical protein